MRRMYDKNEIKSIASESGGGKVYVHNIKLMRKTTGLPKFTCQVLSSRSDKLQLLDFKGNVGLITNAQISGKDEDTIPANSYIAKNEIDIPNLSGGLSKAVIVFSEYYPFEDVYSSFEFSLTDGQTEYSDTVTEL